MGARTPSPGLPLPGTGFAAQKRVKSRLGTGQGAMGLGIKGRPTPTPLGATERALG